MIGEVDDGFIDVDDGHASMESLYILGGGELSLQLASHLVMDLHDGLDLAIACVSNYSQILTEVWTTDSEMTRGGELFLDLSQSQRSLSLVDDDINKISSALMDLVEARHLSSPIHKWIAVGIGTATDPFH
jgi:hypothetical protein